MGDRLIERDIDGPIQWPQMAEKHTRTAVHRKTQVTPMSMWKSRWTNTCFSSFPKHHLLDLARWSMGGWMDRKTVINEEALISSRNGYVSISSWQVAAGLERRVLVQWIVGRREKKVTNPYWCPFGGLDRINGRQGKRCGSGVQTFFNTWKPIPAIIPSPPFTIRAINPPIHQRDGAQDYFYHNNTIHQSPVHTSQPLSLFSSFFPSPSSRSWFLVSSFQFPPLLALPWTERMGHPLSLFHK